MKTVCWNGIVKNESVVIERCMRSMVGQIDYWVIVDTGSTDGTQHIIQDFMREHGIPGELLQRPWVNFSHNRSEALSLAEQKADYLLLCDADMALQVHDSAWKNQLHDDMYMVVQSHDSLVYRNARLINARLEGDQRIRYWGATHEYLDSIEPGQLSRENFDGVQMLDFGDGGSKADKYDRDIQLLLGQISELEALDTADEVERQRAWDSGLLRHRDLLFSRSIFYLARTMFDTGRFQAALELFRRRVEEGGWDEEVWFCLFRIGLCLEYTKASEADVVQAYLEAFEYRPARAEALYQLARFLEEKSRFQQAYLFISKAVQTPLPDDILFVDRSIYQSKARILQAQLAYRLSRFSETLSICESLLATNCLDVEAWQVVSNLWQQSYQQDTAPVG